MQKCYVKNLKQTNMLAKKFAKTLAGGEIVLLQGDLGAGKTTFTKALFKALGVKEAVTSPTFTLLKEYETKKLTLFHFDMYRLESESEALEFGLPEYFNKPNCICVIEWFERVQSLLPKNNILIKILKVNDNSREFEFLINNKN